MSEYIFECRKLTKKYGKKTALKGINLNLEKGKIIGLLGPNGSGKTTLMKIANGLLRSDEGDLLIGGMSVGINTKKIVSYLPDRDFLPDWMTISELVKMYADFYADFDSEKALSIIEGMGISVKDKLRKLSKGNREKVQIALVMSRRAELYLLDEPIGGVDPVTRDYILESIIGNYSETSTVVIATHLIADVEKILDEVVFIKDGEVILHESVDNIRENEKKSALEMFKEVFA